VPAPALSLALAYQGAAAIGARALPSLPSLPSLPTSRPLDPPPGQQKFSGKSTPRGLHSWC